MGQDEDGAIAKIADLNCKNKHKHLTTIIVHPKKKKNTYKQTNHHQSLISTVNTHSKLKVDHNPTTVNNADLNHKKKKKIKIK